jgi:hypothetical protein
MITQRTFIYGKHHSFRLISEFSVFQMKVEVFDQTGAHALSASKLINLEYFIVGDSKIFTFWRKKWQRAESDERGAYTAVALELLHVQAKDFASIMEMIERAEKEET